MEAINNCSLQFRAKPDCSTIGLKFDVGANTFQLWCTLKHSFACHSNEGFLAKLLEIAQEYLLRQSSGSEQGQSDGDSGNSSSTLLAERSQSPAAPQEQEELSPKLPRSRKKRLKSNEAPKEPCRYCDGSHCESACPIHKPAEQFADGPALWDGFCKSPELSRTSLPSCLAFGAHQTGVVAKRGLAAFTQFGPLIGMKRTEVDIRDDCDMKHMWELQLASGNVYLDTEDPRSSNWMRFVRPAPVRQDRNLSVLIKDSGLYLVSIRALLEGEELLYWQDTFEAGSRRKADKTACGGCNMTFEHPLHYKVHCSLFHDTRFSLTIRKYHCKVCGAAILGKDNIRKHAAEQHNGKGAYQCQYCNKFFLRLNYLEMHRTYGCSANPQRSKSLCDFCGRNFCQPQKLKIHIKRMHSDLTDVLKDFQCSKCLKLLGSRAALQRHLKEVHDKQGDASYPCTICTKHFQNKSNLKIHMLTHSGIKPFKCTVEACGAAFTTKQCLQLHYRKVHSFDENTMPKIERAVSYTLQAYSGDQKAQPEEQPGGFEEACDFPEAVRGAPEILEAPLGTQTLHTVEQMIKEPATAKLVTKGEKKWMSESLKSFEEAEPKYSIAEFSRRETSNASLLVEAALDSVCNDASLDIDVEVSHTVPDCPDLYTLQEDYQSQDINLISPSVNDHISVTDELEGDIKGPGMQLQYGQLAEDQFRPPSSHSPKGAESSGRSAFIHGGWLAESPRRYELAHQDLLAEDSIEGKPLDRLRVKSSIRMHDYFRRLWFEENSDCAPQGEGALLETDLDGRPRLYDPTKAGDMGLMESRETERHFEPAADLQGLDMSTRSFHNYPANVNRFHPVYPELDLRLNYTPPPYDLVRVVSLDLTPPERHSVDLTLRGLPLHPITNSRLLGDHGLGNKHRIFDQARLLGGDLGPGGEQLGEHARPLIGDNHLAFGAYSAVTQPGYHAAASPASSSYHHPYTYYP